MRSARALRFGADRWGSARSMPRTGKPPPVAQLTERNVMGARFEELVWCPTPMGDLSLRRRRDPVQDVDVYEIKLGDEFLMSSLWTAGETELARLGLAGAR